MREQADEIGNADAAVAVGSVHSVVHWKLFVFVESAAAAASPANAAATLPVAAARSFNGFIDRQALYSNQLAADFHADIELLRTNLNSEEFSIFPEAPIPITVSITSDCEK